MCDVVQSDLIQKPLVSVWCTTYNHEPYIRQCLEGFVLQKTNFRFEVIVHDDASTDGTADIVCEYAKKYPEIIKPILQQENQYSKHDDSIQRAIDAAMSPMSKYVAMCEGDDYWIDPYKLQKQVDFLETHSEYGLCYAKAKCFNQEKQQWEGKLGEDYVSFDNLLCENTIPTVTVMFRKILLFQYYREIDIYKMNWKMGDYPLWLWIAEKSKLYFQSQTVAVYRILKESASHSQSQERYIQFYQSCRDIQIFFIKRHGELDLLRWVDEYYNIRLYQLCLENDFSIDESCVDYFKTNVPCSIKGKLFKISIKYKPIECVLRIVFKNKFLIKIYHGLF